MTDFGVWFASHGCYAAVASPQPWSTHPAWDGHTPDEGQLWACTDNPGGTDWYWFVPNEGLPTLQWVDPGVLAQQAFDQLQLELANARVAPPPTFHTYVHYKNWMWVPQDQWRRLSLAVSAGPTTVSVTADPVSVEWDMGPETVSCPDGGREWVTGMPEDAPTTCSYTYDTMVDPYGDTWPVSAQIIYDVDWACTGACTMGAGTLGEVTAPPGETTTMRVLQRQTVVVR